MKRSLFFFLLFAMFSSCQSPQDKPQIITDVEIDPNSLPEWAKDANIYEVNLRQYTEEGTIMAFMKHIDRLKNMGVEILWFMPVHPISVEKRKATGDTLVKDIEDPEERAQYKGSPYAVADYKALNPDFGTDEDFRNMVKAIHDADMKIIIDWVPNHTGWDHKWITEHPDWYTQNDKGEIIDPINYETGESWGWTDVADLNYENQDMRKEMLSDMLYWVTNFDIDGFRVDVAHGIEQSFWDEMKASIHQHKHLFLLAESEVPAHRNSGDFHASYAWSFHHLMNEIAKGTKNVRDIYARMKEDSIKHLKGSGMYFTSNHDENAWAGTEFDRMGDAYKVMAVLAYTFDGIPLMYSGQEEPLKRRLSFFGKDNIDFREFAMEDFYHRLMELKKSNEALYNGEYGAKATILFESDDILAFRRKKGDHDFIAYLNLSEEPQSFEADVQSNKLKDVFTGEIRDLEMNTRIELGPWGYTLLSHP